MIDIKILRENPERIRENLEKREMRDFPLDELVALDKRRRDSITTSQKLKEEKNRITLEIADLKKKGEEASVLIEKMRGVSDEITRNDDLARESEVSLVELVSKLPNFLDSQVPIGSDAVANKLMWDWGKPERRNTMDHMEIAQTLDLIDVERAAKVSGARFSFLKRDLARLNFALMTFALDFLRERGFILVQPPYMLKREAIGGAIILSDFEDVIYKIEGEDLYLIGTSEHAIASMHMKEILEEKSLPLRYAGVSPCFRKEAGAHGKDTKGIFRVHQFDKVEQFVFCKPQDSEEEHRKLLKNAEDFTKKLGIPYRVMLLSSGDMGKVPAKTFDIEGWIPSQDNYRELISCSNCTDFQARSLGIKFREKPHEESKFVHTLNSTLVATSRMMVAILENFYERDAKSVKIPELLRPYMNFQTSIKVPN